MSGERTPPSPRRLRELARRGIHAPRWAARWWLVVLLLVGLAAVLWRQLVQATIQWIEFAVLAPGGPDTGQDAVRLWATAIEGPLPILPLALLALIGAVRLLAGPGLRSQPDVDARDAVLRTALMTLSLGFSAVAAWCATSMPWLLVWLAVLAILQALDVWRQRAAFDRQHGMTEAERRAEARDEAAPAATRRRPRGPGQE